MPATANNLLLIHNVAGIDDVFGGGLGAFSFNRFIPAPGELSGEELDRWRFRHWGASSEVIDLEIIGRDATAAILKFTSLSGGSRLAITAMATEYPELDIVYHVNFGITDSFPDTDILMDGQLVFAGFGGDAKEMAQLTFSMAAAPSEAWDELVRTYSSRFRAQSPVPSREI